MTITAEQRAMRAQGIGGSDAAIIAGASPYKTPVGLWLEKTGQADAADATLPMKIGTALENLILNEWALQTGREVRVVKETIRDPREPILFGHLDAMTPGAAVVDGEGTVPEGVEAKWVGQPDDAWGESNTDLVPPHVFIQCTHYLMLTGWPRWHVAALLGGREVRVYSVQRDEGLIARLREAELAFWSLVVSRVPPPMLMPQDARLLYPRSTGGEICATPAIMDTLSRLRHVRQETASYVALADRLQAEVQAFMGAHGTLTDASGDTLATWRSARAGSRLDAAALRVKYPLIAKEFDTPSAGTRRFLLKGDCA